MWKKIEEKFRNICVEIRRRRELRRMDEFWNLFGGSCFDLFPPSFYYKHSEEEIERMQQEEIAKLKKLLNEFVARHEQNEKKV